MNQFYEGVGISKQAVHQYSRRQTLFDHRLMELMSEADDIRRDHPGCGVEKMYYTLKPDFIGRDRFVETFMQLGYRLKKKKELQANYYCGEDLLSE